MFDKNFHYSEIDSLSNDGSLRLSNNSSQPSDDIVDIIKRMPTTRYYGSKRKLLFWLNESLGGISFNTVLDAFGGTASVSLLLKAMGKEVTFNDVLLSNTICAQALLSNHNPVKIEEFEKLLQSVIPVEGFISTTFKDIFYTEDENRWLDGVINSIRTLSAEKQSVFLYCLFQACLQKRPFNLFHRANLNLRLNDSSKRSFGNLTTWNSSFLTLALRSFLELDRSIWDSPKNHSILNSDVCNLDTGYDFVYLDPPYLASTSNADNYLSKYHFLEGISVYNNWIENINFASKCLSFHHNENITKWHNKKEFENLLYEVIKRHKKSIVGLSYVGNSHPSIESLHKFFSQTFKRTKVFTKLVSRSLSKTKQEELLFIGLP